MFLITLLLLADSLTIYVVHHGWHAGLALPTAAISEDQLPVLRDFPHTRYLEIGWGDAIFYQHPSPSPGDALRALFWPTPSVLHVAGLTTSPDTFFFCQSLLQLRLSTEQFYRLVDAIARSFAHDTRGHPVRLKEGLYGRSFFYASVESYHAFHTCNVWLARKLHEAGLPLHPLFSLTVDYLWAQLQALGASPQTHCM